MPPGTVSRHQFSVGLKDGIDRLFLSERTRYTFKNFSDNIRHEVKDGDTLFNIAGRYYKAFDRPAGLWWIIGDFQEDPIFDPTLKLTVGRIIVVPSIRTIQEEIFSASRASEA